MFFEIILKSISPCCLKPQNKQIEPEVKVCKQISPRRLSLFDINRSEPSTFFAKTGLPSSLIGWKNIQNFTVDELKLITNNFSSCNFIGKGGFGPVYKGVIDDRISPGVAAHQTVAVKPLLRDSQKLDRIIDPKLDGEYSRKGAKKLATLAYHCLSHNSKTRPTMVDVVMTLEPLLDLDDIPINAFVYTVPILGECTTKNIQDPDGKYIKDEKKQDGNDCEEEVNEVQKNYVLRSSRSRGAVYSDSVLHTTLKTGYDLPIEVS
ncbi:hypothetical protein AG4045_001454 [Apium graveolens]|uniref:Protein kinase domain-containing protein n=1 Tax=Apium graveolens TaxID=4045 RepID=A0A6L5BA38_APIGR|nr:hypothetical protein AG4045_001454 [Apium graveolens]